MHVNGMMADRVKDGSGILFLWPLGEREPCGATPEAPVRPRSPAAKEKDTADGLTPTIEDKNLNG